MASTRVRTCSFGAGAWSFSAVSASCRCRSARFSSLSCCTVATSSSKRLSRRLSSSIDRGRSCCFDHVQNYSSGRLDRSMRVAGLPLRLAVAAQAAIPSLSATPHDYARNTAVAHGLACAGGCRRGAWHARRRAVRARSLPVRGLAGRDPARGGGAGQAEPALATVYAATVASLRGREMDFDLLIPGDDRSIQERTRALTSWCTGFLYGLGSNGAADPQRLPGDLARSCAT